MLVPTRLALAQFLQNLANTETQVQGLVDHVVSEAIYLPDPDGNGIEVYRDKPKEDWQYEPNGDIRMGNLPLDFDGVMAEFVDGDDWGNFSEGTVLGHMHLHVGQIEESIQFYKEIIGLDLMLELGKSAAFLSTGGYHHHLGINTWNGVGALPPPPKSIGLNYFSIQFPKPTEIKKLVTRAREADITVEKTDDGFLLRDPSQNGILLTATSNSP